MLVEPRFIPTLLLEDGRFVKTRRFADPEYVGDPVNVLSIFNDFVVDEIVILDISAARTRMPSAMGRLRQYAEECFIPLAYGGGLTTLEQVDELFHAGYEKAVLNTLLADDPQGVAAAADRYGSQAVVASIDVRGGPGERAVVVRGGTEVVAGSPSEWARRSVDLGAGEVLVTSVDREGTGDGFDLPLIEEVANAVDVPVIAHGGAGSRADLPGPVHQASASAVAAGSLFVFQGRDHGVLINYPSRRQIERLLSDSSPVRAGGVGEVDSGDSLGARPVPEFDSVSTGSVPSTPPALGWVAATMRAVEGRSRLGRWRRRRRRP